MRRFVILMALVSAAVAAPGGVKGRRVYESKTIETSTEDVKQFTTELTTEVKKCIPGLVPPSDQRYDTIDQTNLCQEDQKSSEEQAEDESIATQFPQESQQNESKQEESTELDQNEEENVFSVTLSTVLQPPQEDSLWHIMSKEVQDKKEENYAPVKGVKGGFYKRRIVVEK